LKDTCISESEDDPQDGWDHVSGYRTTAYFAVLKRARRGYQRELQTAQSSAHDGLMFRIAAMNQLDAALGSCPLFSRNARSDTGSIQGTTCLSMN